MSRTVRIVLGLVAVAALAGVLFLGYIFLRGGTGEATISIEDAAATRAANAPTETVIPASADITPETIEVAEDATSEADAVPTEAPSSQTASSGVVFSIVPDESEVRFQLQEDLRGTRTTVIGTTNEVAGDVTVNFDDPSQSDVGTILINLRTIATDNEFRNRAIRGEILQSARDEFEFGEFDPTSIAGLPDTVTMGEAFTFQVTGNLVLRGVSNEVTFDVTVTPVSETRIEGSASAVVNRTLYGMEIPSAPGVANVDEEVQLSINFVATAE